LKTQLMPRARKIIFRAIQISSARKRMDAAKRRTRNNLNPVKGPSFVNRVVAADVHVDFVVRLEISKDTLLREETDQLD